MNDLRSQRSADSMSLFLFLFPFSNNVFTTGNVFYLIANYSISMHFHHFHPNYDQFLLKIKKNKEIPRQNRLSTFKQFHVFIFLAYHKVFLSWKHYWIRLIRSYRWNRITLLTRYSLNNFRSKYRRPFQSTIKYK